MGSKERRERERDEVRGRILAAARDLFAIEGYEAVTMRRIAEKIEYTATALYFHFKDKESLLRALCDADFLQLAGEFGPIAAVGDPVERLRLIGMAYAGFALGHPNHYRLMFMTPNALEAKDSTLERGNPQQDAYAMLRATVAEAIAAGRMREGIDDIDLAAQIVWAGVHGVVSLHIAKGCDEWVPWRDARATVEATIDAMLRGLLRDRADG